MGLIDFNLLFRPLSILLKGGCQEVTKDFCQETTFGNRCILGLLAFFSVLKAAYNLKAQSIQGQNDQKENRTMMYTFV